MAEKLYLHDVNLDSNRLLHARMHPVTTVQRLALAGDYGITDEGVLVFDITLDLFYVWDGTQWITVGDVTSSVPTSRTITINNVTQDLSADRTWTVQNLPSGGDAGDILAKSSATDYDVTWIPNYTSDVKHYVKLGANMSKGTPVYVSGSTGNSGTNMIVSAASNLTEATSSKTLGILASGGLTNEFVFVVTEGLLSGLDTAHANAGDPVWLGPNGTLIYGVANKPKAPIHLVYLGVVTRSHAVNGEIFVHVVNGFELDELHDVQINSAADKDLIYRDGATNLWKNGTISTAIGYTPADDSLVVHLAGTETITGTKTFSATITASSFVKSGGTSSQFLKADGSVDSTAYLTAATWKTDYDATISGSRNSSNKIFTLSDNFVSNSLRVYVNGIRYSPGAGNDYIETPPNQLTFNIAPDLGDLIVVDYIKS